MLHLPPLHSVVSLPDKWPHSGHSVCVKRSIDLEHLTSNQVATGSITARPTKRNVANTSKRVLTLLDDRQDVYSFTAQWIYIPNLGNHN